MVGTAARKVFSALVMEVTVAPSMVPSVSKMAFCKGTRKVDPTTRRWFTIPAVCQRICIPTPLANSPLAPPVSDPIVPELENTPLRSPVLSSMLSPLGGKVQVTPGGNAMI
jgi:hypothetical protein